MRTWGTWMIGGVAAAALVTSAACGSSATGSTDFDVAADGPSLVDSGTGAAAPAARPKRGDWHRVKTWNIGKGHQRDGESHTSGPGGIAKFEIRWWRKGHNKKKGRVEVWAGACDFKKDGRSVIAVVSNLAKTKRGWRHHEWIFARDKHSGGKCIASGVMKSIRPVDQVSVRACLMNNGRVLERTCDTYR